MTSCRSLTARALLATALGVLAPLSAWAEKLSVVQVAPLSGLEATLGRAYGAGMDLAFQAANRQGLNGHTLQLVKADDHHRAEDTLAETRRLLAEARPIALAGYVGDEAVSALLKSGLLEQERVPLVGFKAIALDPDHPLVFSPRAGMRLEVAKLAQHLRTVGIERVALFHEEGAQGVQQAVEAAFKEHSLKLVGQAAYPAGTARASAAAEKLLGSNAQAILIVASSSAAAAFIENYRGSGGSAQLFAHSGADIEQLAKRLAEQHTRGLAIAQVVPNPYKIALRLTKEFRELAAATQPPTPVSFTMLEGYITGRLIVEAVRRQGAKPTREGIAAAIESFGSLDLQGLRLSFSPQQRTGSRLVELSIVNQDGRIQQ
ncbi:ABC transporter substrate-binding protein [Ideonella livida]|uniref:ABC transporter substrate-binding protein n=1 Tax=Ideonella livida TaxID=2707176 RepID=A0A7C9PFR7_9BURK|nr:ABC transporter substrate-binding protein [Ideonella livida]NDY89954.1 ABC transporter substrate-binding protein [Ideonella livida]